MENKQKMTQGERLKECMKLRNKKNAALETMLQQKGSSIRTDSISHMRGDRMSISYHNAMLIADCLDVDEGYLMGKDDFKASSYNEYLVLMGKADQVEKYTPDLKRKVNILDLAGYSLRANFNEGASDGVTETPFVITIAKGNNGAEITYNKLDEIEKNVIHYATTLIDAAVSESSAKVTITEKSIITQYQGDTFDSPDEFKSIHNKK